MKKIFCFLFIISASFCFAQSLEKLKSDTKKLYEANYLMDFDAIAQLTYPKIIEESGQEVWREKIEKYYENDEYRLRLQLETVPFKFSPIKTIEGKQFCVITCSSPMRYFFEKKLTDEEGKAMASKMKDSLKANEIIFEPKRNSFNVRKISTFVAVIDQTTSNQWKFFNFDDKNQENVFRSFFSERILKELGL